MGEDSDSHDNPRGETPLRPAFEFNAPGASVALYEGPITGLANGERPGRIELNCGPRVGLRWYADLKPNDHHRLNSDKVELKVRRGGQEWAIEAYERSCGEGGIEMAAFPRANARLHRVLVGWMNLPNIVAPIILTISNDDTQGWRRGRWRTEINGWRITLDLRPDYTDALASAHETHLYVLTHVMEIRRTDQGEFAVDDVEGLLDCLRVTFSFAFGRWVAPVLPVGYDSAGNVAWEVWGSPICDPANAIGSPSLYRGRPDDLIELVRCAVPAFNDTSKPGSTRLQMSLAVQAVETGRVEQRILAAAPALENLTWSELVLTNRWTQTEYKNRNADTRLRYLLQSANIPTDIDQTALPALARFARAKRIDGPTAVTRVRNRLVHPTKAFQDEIYQRDDLLNDIWHLSRRYATLLVLHSIGYHSDYVDPVRNTGWEGSTVPVPWKGAGTIPTPAMPPPDKTAPRRPKGR